MNQISLKWDLTQGKLLQSIFSSYEFFDHYSYFTLSLNSVMSTTIALSIIYYCHPNYLIWKLLTDATFGIIISFMQDYHHNNLL